MQDEKQLREDAEARSRLEELLGRRRLLSPKHKKIQMQKEELSESAQMSN